jgi:hypothetical protein
VALSRGARARRFPVPLRRGRGPVRDRDLSSYRRERYEPASGDPGRRRRLQNAVLGTGDGTLRYDPAVVAKPVRTVIGTVLDASPHVLVIGDDSGKPEHRFALTDATSVWRGGPVPPTALQPGQRVVVRRAGPRSADRVWSDIGRVTGTIVERSGDTLVVDQGHTRRHGVIAIDPRSADRIQVRFPWLQPGYLIDVIGLRDGGELQGLVPATNQPPYRGDQVPGPPLVRGGLPEAVTGTVSWHEPPGHPRDRCGVAYPAIDPDTGCGHEGDCDLGVPCTRLPYLSVGSMLAVRNDCTAVSGTVPVTGCGSAASRFCDRCLSCGTSPRGRIADLTVAAFVELGGELEKSCFNATITMGG